MTHEKCTDYEAIVNRLIEILQNGTPGKALLEYVKTETVNELNEIFMQEIGENFRREIDYDCITNSE